VIIFPRPDAGIDRVGGAAGFRFVPFAAVEGIAMVRQMQHLGFERLKRDCGVLVISLQGC
jgi:hypothetical protein